jgi:hypothetical protein
MEQTDDLRIEPLLAQARKEFTFEVAIRKWAIEKILAADLMEDLVANLSDHRLALEAWGKSKDGRRDAMKLHAEAQKRLSQKIEDASARARFAANARHDKAGGSREKSKEMRTLWASGKYTSKDICAEEESRALGISFSAARKAIRTPKRPS